MTSKYWVGGFFIDPSRNQITQNSQSQTIAPKALAVLTYLAEYQGHVVSQDELLTKIWPDTAVTPNTLQRCIAQLRKALGDDGKNQQYIKTHAKKGYSLECDVRWHSTTVKADIRNTEKSGHVEPDPNDTPNKAQTTNNRSFSIKALFLPALFFLVFLVYRYHFSNQTSQIVFKEFRSLTATDDKEFDASYSPDGQYIVFHRYLENYCINKLCAKHLDTKKEYLLTEEWANYGGHSFSKDGKHLVFLKSEACNESSNQNTCYQLMSLAFEKALDHPQVPRVLLQCQNSEVRKPVWLNDATISLMQRESKRWKLVNYSITENKSTDFYAPTDGNLIDYAYSAKDERFAVIRAQEDGHQRIEILMPDGKIQSSQLIDFPEGTPKFRSVYPTFFPLNHQLIFCTGRQLFTLSFDGKINKISLPFADKMFLPRFHPNGTKVLLIKGPLDSDIVRIERQGLPKTDTSAGPDLEIAWKYSTFERSNLGEDHARFQPEGELVAFWSDRSGDEQIWISDGNGPQQLTHFPMDTYIRGLDWSADGTSLMVNANHVLTKVNLDSTHQAFQFEYPVVHLFQWDSRNNKALVLARIKGIVKLAEFNLTSLQIQVISDRIIKWAQKAENGSFIFQDQLGKFWQSGPIEAQLIQPLKGQAGNPGPFVVRHNTLYSTNSSDQLWSFNLNEGHFEILGDIENGGYLSDVSQTHFLMTIQVSARKEVVELTLED